MATYISGEIETREATDLEDGVYDFVVMNAREGETDIKRTPYIELECAVVSGGYTVDGPKKYIHKESLYFTEKSGWRIDQYRASRGDTVVAGEAVEMTANSVLGDTFKAKIHHKPGKDGTGNWPAIHYFIERPGAEVDEPF